MSSEEEMSHENEEEESDVEVNKKSVSSGRGRTPKKMYKEIDEDDDKAVKSPVAAKAGSENEKEIEDDDDDDEDDFAYEDDDDDYSEKVKKSKSPARGRGRPKGRGRGRPSGSSTPGKGRGRPSGTPYKGRGRPPGKSPAKSPAKSQAKSSKQYSDDDDENDSRTRKSISIYKEDSESDDWEPEPPPPKRKRGGRPRQLSVSDEDSDFKPYRTKINKGVGRPKSRGPYKKKKGLRNVICELGQVFYQLGWVSGTGGGISIKDGENILVAPSGVQKEQLEPEDMFELDLEGDIIETPKGKKQLSKSQCTPLFLLAYNKRNAGAVIHSHSKAAVLATLRFPGPEFKISHIEMIKGIKHGSEDRQMHFDETIVVPIIENTTMEADLVDSMAKAMEQYPDTHAILVRRHGVYVWGETWEEAKTMAECYDYLFDIAVQMKGFNLDPCQVPKLIKENGN